MKQTWDKWELLAIEYLKRNGYEIKDVNFKFSIFWEVDIIAKKDDLHIFLEVKFRTNTAYGTPEESIIKSKLKKLKKTIEYYCLTNKVDFEKIRFDVIAIQQKTSSYELKHYRNIEI